MGSAREEPNLHKPASLELAKLLPETEEHDAEYDVDVDVSMQLHGCHQFVWLDQKCIRDKSVQPPIPAVEHPFSKMTQ